MVFSRHRGHVSKALVTPTMMCPTTRIADSSECFWSGYHIICKRWGDRWGSDGSRSSFLATDVTSPVPCRPIIAPTTKCIYHILLAPRRGHDNVRKRTSYCRLPFHHTNTEAGERFLLHALYVIYTFFSLHRERYFPPSETGRIKRDKKQDFFPVNKGSLLRVPGFNGHSPRRFGELLIGGSIT